MCLPFQLCSVGARCRCGVEATPDTVALFQVDNQSSRELRHYLTNIAGQCTAVADSTTSSTAHADDDDDDDDEGLVGQRRSPLMTATLPRVVILDNLHRVTSLSDVFNGFLSVPYQCRLDITLRFVAVESFVNNLYVWIDLFF